MAGNSVSPGLTPFANFMKLSAFPHSWFDSIPPASSARRVSVLALAMLLLGGAGALKAAIPMLDSPMAYVLERGTAEATLTKEKINDTLDIFGVKDDIVAGLNPATFDLGALGDLDGWRTTVNFGLSDRMLLRYQGKRHDLDFGRGKLKRVGEELAMRVVVLRETDSRPAISLEPVFRANRGSGLSRTFASITAFGLTITPATPVTLEFGGVKDETYALRALFSKRLGEDALVSLWGEYGSTNVGSELKTNLNIAEIRRIVDALEYSSHQMVLGAGGHYFFNDRLIAYGEYQHYSIDRSINSKIAGVVDTNDTFKARLSYGFSPVGWVSLEGLYFSNNLGGELPFVFNELSANRFDRVYGYVGLGVTFQVSYDD